MFSMDSLCFPFSFLFNRKNKISRKELSWNCKGTGGRGVAMGQEIGNDENDVAGDIVIMEPNSVFDVNLHMRGSAF